MYTGSCASSKDVPLLFEKNFMDTTPEDGCLVFIGVSRTRLKREEAIQLALEDAARRVAFFHFVEGRIIQQENKGLGFLDFNMATEKSLSFSEDFKTYINYLEYDSN
jgi:hypothetical protein